MVGSDSYLYDLNGNITKQVTGGATTFYGYNAADQMCWSATTTGCTTPTGGTAFSYAGNGNTITVDATTGTNTWTSFDQLASVTVWRARAYTYEDTSNAQRTTAGGGHLHQQRTRHPVLRYRWGRGPQLHPGSRRHVDRPVD